MSVRIHYFKTWPEPFGACASGAKRYEIRKDDRPELPRVGDLVVLQEWRPGIVDKVQGDYTGRELRVRVTYLTEPKQWGLPEDLYVFGFRPE